MKLPLFATKVAPPFIEYSKGPKIEDAIEIVPSLTPHADVLVVVAVIVGSGLTVIVYVTGVPEQPFTDGMTVMVDVMGDDVAFTAVKLCTLPVPLASERPVEVLEFVQEYVAPEGELEKLEDDTTSPEQTVMLAGTVTVGRGFTVIR